MNKLTKEQIIDSYTKDIEKYLDIGLCESQANAFFGKDLTEHFNIMASYFKEIVLLEEELGIDLLTLFKALKQGEVYVKSGNKVDWDIPMSGFQICGDKTNGITLWSQVRLEPKDYGKTWALTKEELL